MNHCRDGTNQYANHPSALWPSSQLAPERFALSGTALNLDLAREPNVGRLHCYSSMWNNQLLAFEAGSPMNESDALFIGANGLDLIQAPWPTNGDFPQTPMVWIRFSGVEFLGILNIDPPFPVVYRYWDPDVPWDIRIPDHSLFLPR